mmetsp:Transcript_52273/g.118029  ORF Transcript_52273/g.118029 Transcript_52273/m.118029 type:complete len:243 (-) Transcript_52273:89-817(-)
MVIPMGGMGPPLMGPPPPELEGRFRVLKYCVLGMMVATAIRIVTACLIPKLVGQVILASVNIVLNAIIGIFLLKHDPLMGRMHNFLVTTCCSSCEDTCGGGMSCLITFALCNTITVVFDLLLNGVIGWIISAIGAVFDPAQWTSPIFGFVLAVNVISVILCYVTQTTGAVQGFLAYRQARDSGVTATPGDWGGGGGGPYMGGGFPQQGRAPMNAGRDDAPARESRPNQNFQPFSGGGQRLGS